ncbi:MAG: hypothetical protein RLZZ347_797 [Candidatus Parcubacteria bacterium]|jgi:hypothetical protein
METLSSGQISLLSATAFKERLNKLSAEFSAINQSLIPIAKEIENMKKGCLHRNSESRPYARWCHDCGEYYAIDTSFSK